MTRTLTQKGEEQANRSRILNAVDHEVKAFETFAREHYGMVTECLVLVAQRWVALSDEARARAVERNAFVRSQADLWNRIAAKSLHPFLVECSLPSDKLDVLGCLPYEMQTPEEMNRPRKLYGRHSGEVREKSLIAMTTMELAQVVDRKARALRTPEQQASVLREVTMARHIEACKADKDPEPVIPLGIAKWTDDGGVILTKPLPNPSIIPARLAKEIARGQK